MPEIAVEGELELEDALVLDDVSDEAALKQAHEQGRAIVVRAGLRGGGEGGARRPEVASVLVPADKRELLELDLTELTYG